MFEDFSKKRDREARRRFTASLTFALVAFGMLAATAVAATSVAPPPEEEEEELVVEFAPPPEPEPEPEVEVEPPPEPVPPSPNPRPRVNRQEMLQPDEIPDEELEESDADLVDGEEGGPVDGFTDGAAGGRGSGRGAAPEPEPEPEPEPPPRPSGPIQLPENGVPAQRVGDPPALDYPEDARTAGIQGAVLVRCAIGLDGTPEQCRVLRGAPELRDAALAWAERNRFSPARLEDGTPVVTWKVLPVIFRLTNI